MELDCFSTIQGLQHYNFDSLVTLAAITPTSAVNLVQTAVKKWTRMVIDY